jgi:hypothetical protein
MPIRTVCAPHVRKAGAAYDTGIVANPVARAHRSAPPRLYAEVTDFGYGPAHALITALKGWDDAPATTIFSSGNAAKLLRRALPSTELVELDCSRPAAWHAFVRHVPAASPVLTLSPSFARFASGSGYRVGLVDQLDWMWHQHANTTSQFVFHIIQAYFGMDLGRQARHGELVSPIVDPCFTSRGSRAEVTNSALLGFGGMSMMGRTNAADGYFHWILDSALPILLDEGGCETVVIVGGREDLRSLAPARWRRDRRLSFITAVPPDDYAQLLCCSRHQLLTPGLATIYECAALGIAPLLGPGLNKSMLLQLDDLARLGYRHIVRWPFHDELCHQVRRLPQPEALPRISNAVGRAVAASAVNSGWVSALIREYVTEPPARVPLTLPNHDCPDARDAIRAALSDLVAGPRSTD